MPTKTYEISILLLYSDPVISRAVVVPSDVTLGQLHEIIQIAMGWTNSHLHEFATATSPADERRFVQQLNAWGESTELEGEDEDAFTLEVCPEVGSRMPYTYDYGDNWEHLLEVVKISEEDKRPNTPLCLSGQNACPPEDCGGVMG